MCGARPRIDDKPPRSYPALTKLMFHSNLRACKTNTARSAGSVLCNACVKVEGLAGGKRKRNTWACTEMRMGVGGGVARMVRLVCCAGLLGG